MNPYDKYIINQEDESLYEPLYDPRHYHYVFEADYKERIKKEGKVGDCYEKNYKAFWDIYNKTKNKNLKYVIAYIKYHKSGNQILHAFLLDGDDMIDKSQNRDYRISFDGFQRSMAEVTFSKVWNCNTIPRWEGIINRFETYESMIRSEMTWDDGIEKQIGSWDIAKLEVL